MRVICNLLKVKFLLLVVACPFTVYPDTIFGKIDFLARPAYTGIVFVKAAHASAKSPVLDQKKKHFSSKIVVGSPNEMMTFKNSDSFEHNIYANDMKQNVRFDIGLMSPSHSVQLLMDWQQPSLVRMGCKIHPKMRSYVANIKSDIFHSFNFDRNIKSYSFKLEDVPSERLELILLMPRYDNQHISIKQGESRTLDIAQSGKVKAHLTLTRR